MALINIKNLTFAYDGSYNYIFDDVSFQIDTDWKLGFIGRNGRGKTTFLNILLGKFSYRGSITSPVEFEYFPYEVADRSRLTYDAVTDICPELELWELERELSLLEADTDVLWRPFDTLSYGEQTKVLLAAMFLKHNRFLLIDEPTNHLDIRGRELVSRYLNSKKGFILVSHDRAFLDGCIDHVLSINKADIEVQRGNFSSWYENKERRDRFELAENDRLKKEIKRLTQTAREKAEWADVSERRKVGIDPHEVDSKKGFRPLMAAKSKKMMSRAKAIETRQQAAIEEKSKLLKNIEESDDLKLIQSDYHSRRMVTLRGVSVAYGTNTVCSDVSFTVDKGDRIVLSGRNGSGKSSILRLINGEDIPHTGIVEVGSRLKISYAAQDASPLTGSLSDYAARYGIDQSRFMTILRKLDFSRSQFDLNMREFSGGQKKKVVLARTLCEDASLHIWDEPMNYIDVISRMQIEELLLSSDVTLLFVEHDRVFCERIANKTVEL